MQAKHSEVLKDTVATLSCEVTGLTKVLDAVTWEKPNSGGVITHDTGGYKIDVGTYQKGSNSQTTTLTIPAAANANVADSVYTCVIRSDEHGKTAESPEKTNVNLNVFSKLYKLHSFHIYRRIFMTSCI